ncbi:hypothetical protein RI129_007496 [Pyrocoelia pectoralis]|uniref:Endonuclease/exonuclease/phosphatase domain-containing protein n=1 Tax=Pyrocoelia pectoralis TaxID=417401 RepID=A0AAN7VEJ8_9COLE
MQSHSPRFFVHLFHLEKFLFKTLNSKFRKRFLNPFSLICVKYKYLKYITSNTGVETMNSHKCTVCNKLSITESSQEVQNIACSSSSASISGMQKKEEKSSRYVCKESIKLVNDFGNKRKPISFTIKKKNDLLERKPPSFAIKKKNDLLDKALAPSNKSGNNLYFTHTPQIQTNFFLSNQIQPFAHNYLNVVPISLNNLFHQSFVNNSQIQHRVYRSSAADYSNNTKSSQLDKQMAWSLRKLQYTNLGKSLANKPQNPKSCTFKIMSYNVLAQELLEEHPFLYTYHNPNALKWDQRWYSILGEIKFHKADILCLQEVQVSHLEQYNEDLGKLGYKGVYKQRTGIRRDGCAIYYKESIFNLVEHVTIEFNQQDIPVLDRDNIAIVAKFAPNNNSKNEFVVATTHLLYNRKREDVRLAQTQVLLTEIDRIAYKFDPRRSTDHLPVIITGDFNLTPESPVYRFLTQGVLKYEHLTNRTLTKEQSQYANVTGKVLLPTLLRITDNCQHADLVEKRNTGDLSREEELKLIHLQHSERKFENKSGSAKSKSPFSTGTLSHNFNLMSAYVHYHGNDSEATTFQDTWVTVDYIFYSGENTDAKNRSQDRLKLISRFTLPTTYRLEGMKIPNMALGSDHLSLVVVFRLDP